MSTELDDLKKRVAELEKAAKPAEPFKSEWKGPRDYTEGMSMPRSAMLEMVRATASVMADIRADARKPNPVTEASSSPVTSTPAALPQRRNTGGWRDEVPLGPQPGIEHVDRLVDAQDAKDRAELALKLAKVELSKSK